MEGTEAPKEWFVTHEGKQFGPVSIDDLKFEAERGQLDPRLDMVWKSGMESWIPAGEVEGLFKRNDEAKAEEQAKQTAFTEYQPELSEEERKLIKGEWTGVGRGTYVFVCFILPFLWVAAVGYAMKHLEGRVDAGYLAIGGLALSLVPVLLAFASVLKRFQNMAMSRWWILGLLVPLLNFWVAYRLLACPPGYAYHRKLDPIGWALAVFHWGSLLLVVSGVSYGFVILTQSKKDDPIRVTIESYIEKARQAAEKGKPKEKR